jgi:hypothetical protein
MAIVSFSHGGAERGRKKGRGAASALAPFPTPVLTGSGSMGWRRASQPLSGHPNGFAVTVIPLARAGKTHVAGGGRRRFGSSTCLMEIRSTEWGSYVIHYIFIYRLKDRI